MSLRDLLEARSRTVEQMRALTDHPSGDGGDLTDDQAKQFDDLKAQLTATERRIERQQVVDDAERRMAAPAIIHGRGDGHYEQRARSFSLVKAIQSQLGEDIDVGFEREISAEVKRRAGRKFGGIAVPDEYFQVERRTLLVGSSAAQLYPEQHRDDLFVDMLRSALVVGRVGATILDNLVGDQDIPRQTGSSTAQWVAEDGILTETDATFDDVTLSPKTVGSMTSFSRRAMLNAVPSVENIIRRDLAAVIASAIDVQALTGTGTGNTPTGVINETGVNNLTLDAVTWAQVLSFPAAIQTDNADVGSMAWIMSPSGVAKLRSTAKVASTDSVMLMESPTELAGYPVAVTTALEVGGSPATNTMIFGVWSQLLVGYWSGLDVLLNPFETTAYAKGRVMVRAMRDVDVAVRHGESFAYTNMPD
jgi:HK97 family phage major capsid protein